jgi:hypothetical protein
MNLTTGIREKLGEQWIPEIYREKVRAGRTRSHHLDVPQRENAAEIMFTLLGVELKVGKRRFACPDLAAARYLRVFARLGCTDFAVPYDITRISPIADDLEISWQTTLLHLADGTAGLSAQARGKARAALIRSIRSELAEIGAGGLMPEFSRSTKQRAS